MVLGILLTLALLWPAILNRGVFLFPDTTAYVRGADAAIVKFTGVRSDWSDQLFTRYAKATNIAAAAPAPKVAATVKSNETVLAGRSIYYGTFLFISNALGGFWATIVMQAALASVAVIWALRRVANSARFTTLITLLLLPFVTSLAFYTDFVMPDIFCPLGLLATGLIAIYWREMQVSERWFWSALLLASLCSHSANILIVAVLVVTLAIAKFAVRSQIVTLAPIMGAIILAILAEMIFSAGVAKATGHAPIRPPFVSARLIDDGPGHAYLKETCKTGREFALCRYLDRMPAPSDSMLWSPSSPGIFAAVDADEKRRIAADEPRFVLSVLANRPVDVISSSAAAIVTQLRQFGLMEFNSPHTPTEKLPPRVARDYQATLAANNNFPIKPFEVLIVITFVLSAVLVVASILKSVRSKSFSQMHRLAMVLALGILLNIGVSGALSTPHERYLTRVTWLVPLAALFILAARRTEQEYARPTRARGPMLSA